MGKEIEAYNVALPADRAAICRTLAKIIHQHLQATESKIWHGHPVWFINSNPIVGYSSLKDSIRLLFWSGQGFDEAGLQPEGSFKAAEVRYTHASQINEEDIRRWLQKSQRIQWDYKNIVKRRGVLERLK